MTDSVGIVTLSTREIISEHKYISRKMSSAACSRRVQNHVVNSLPMLGVLSVLGWPSEERQLYIPIYYAAGVIFHCFFRWKLFDES